LSEDVCFLSETIEGFFSFSAYGIVGFRVGIGN
jgi:hypothetical protein